MRRLPMSSPSMTTTGPTEQSTTPTTSDSYATVPEQSIRMARGVPAAPPGAELVVVKKKRSPAQRNKRHLSRMPLFFANQKHYLFRISLPPRAVWQDEPHNNMKSLLRHRDEDSSKEVTKHIATETVNKGTMTDVAAKDEVCVGLCFDHQTVT